jgi:hypothetical protein
VKIRGFRGRKHLENMTVVRGPVEDEPRQDGPNAAPAAGEDAGPGGLSDGVESKEDEDEDEDEDVVVQGASGGSFSFFYFKMNRTKLFFQDLVNL